VGGATLTFSAYQLILIVRSYKSLGTAKNWKKLNVALESGNVDLSNLGQIIQKPSKKYTEGRTF